MSKPLALRWIFQVVATVIFAALTACSSVEFRPVEGSSWNFEMHTIIPRAVKKSFEQAPDCCSSLSKLPYEDLSEAGRKSISISVDSPAHWFDSGKSFFAAYRIVDLPRPALIEVTSKITDLSSPVEKMFIQLPHAVFQPTIVLLNESFEVVRRVNALVPRPQCVNVVGEPAFNLSVLVSESPKEVAYIVLLTSNESLSRQGQVVCGKMRDEMSPVGDLQIQTRVLPSDDSPLRMGVPMVWYPNVRRRKDIGFWQSIYPKDGLLAFGHTALHILESDGARYRQILSIPYANLVRISVDGESGRSGFLSVTSIQENNAPDHRGMLRHDGFVIASELTEKKSALIQLTDSLTAQLAPNTVQQSIAWRVLPKAPLMVVEGGSASRIGQAAGVGAGIVGFPCLICQIGCPPEALLSCTALWGVGALLGGTVGVVKEMFSDSSVEPADRTLIDALAAGGPQLSPIGLEKCLDPEIELSNLVPWQDSGLSAQSILVSGAMASGNLEDSAKGADYLSDVEVRQLALVNASDKKSAESGALWLLRINAQLDLTERISGRRMTRSVNWSSETYARPLRCHGCGLHQTRPRDPRSVMASVGSRQNHRGIAQHKIFSRWNKSGGR